MLFFSKMTPNQNELIRIKIASGKPAKSKGQNTILTKDK